MISTNLVSYNCRGLPSDVNMIPSKPFITKILNNSSFACFQETFYTKQDLPFLNNLHSDFHGTGVTTTDNNDKIMHGHAPGGVAILWRTCFDNCVKPLLFDFNWIVGIELTIDHKKIVLLNVYLPYTHPDNEEEYLNCLGSIACILTELDCTCVMMLVILMPTFHVVFLETTSFDLLKKLVYLSLVSCFYHLIHLPFLVKPGILRPGSIIASPLLTVTPS